jgi:hypothetical protein
MRTVIQENDEWVRLFTPAQRRKLYMETFRHVLSLWRDKYLWKRINAETVKRGPFNYARGGNTPMIGQNVGNRKLINVVGTGSIKAQSPSAKQEIDPFMLSGTVAFPMGHPVINEIPRVFQLIPEDEIKWMVNKWAEVMLDEKNRSTKILKGKRAGQMKLSAAQQKEFRSVKKGGRKLVTVSGRTLNNMRRNR